MLFKSIVPETMAKLYADSKNQISSKRKNDAIKRGDYYHSEQDDYTLENMSTWMIEPEALKPLQINIVRKVIDNLSMVYFKPAKRTVNGTERDTELFNQIAKDSALDMTMKQASKFTKLHKTILLRVVWRNGNLEIDILTPDILDVVIGDSPRDLRKIMVTNWPESGKTSDVTYSLWTADTFQRLDWIGAVIEEEPNPYKTLPFVPCWDSLPIESFWVKGGGDLISAQDAINEKLTDLMYIIRQQGFGIGYIKSGNHGPAGIGTLETVKASPGTFVILPTDPNAEIGFVSPNAPIKEVWETIQAIIQQTAIANGLSAHSLTAEPVNESGISKIVSNNELMEKRQDDVDLWRRYEARLFEICKLVWNTHNTGRKISDTADMNVDFAEITQASQEIEQSEKWQTLIDAGQASPVDWVLSRNPDLSREQAIEYLRNVKKESVEFNSPMI
ncbi:MAG: hypothetical protein WC799_05515 [Desulfobacteraceae bacterium]|jgi:hypothetical protein